MAYHHIDNGGYTATADTFGNLIIEQSSQYYHASMTIHERVSHAVVMDAMFQQVWNHLILEMDNLEPPTQNDMMAKIIDVMTEMEISNLPPFLRSMSSFEDMPDGRVIDAMLRHAIMRDLDTDIPLCVQEYLDAQKNLSMDERYMLACLSTSPLYCRSVTVLRYEYQQIRSLL